MGQYNKAIITAAGENLIARTVAGELKLNINKAKISNHRYPDGTDYKALTDMDGVKQILDYPETKVLDNSMIQTRVLFSNEEIQDAYYVQNIGLYAKDGEEEILFCIVTAEIPDEMPKYNGVASTSYIYNIQNVVQEAAEINIEVVPSGTATIQDVLERVDASGGDISETVIETMESIDTKYPVPSAGESTKVFMGKVKKYIEDTKPLDADMTVYVATTGSDTSGDGTSNKPYKTITYALSQVPRDLGGCAVTINIANGLYPERISVKLYHSGLLLIRGDSTDVVIDSPVALSHYIIDCSARILIEKLTLKATGANTGNQPVMTVLNSSYSHFSNGIVDGTNDTDKRSAFYLQGSDVRFRTQIFNNCRDCIYIVQNATGDTVPSAVSMRGCTGSNNARVFTCRNATIHLEDNSIPTALSPDSVTEGGVIVNSKGAIIGTLSSDINIYVSTVGSDILGDGTQSNPYKTIQHAIDSVPKDLNGFHATINVAVGTYPEDIIISALHNGSFNLYSANKNTLTNTCIINSVKVTLCASSYVKINGFNMITTSTDAVSVLGSSIVIIDYCQSTATSLLNGIVSWESQCIVNHCKIANHNCAVSFGNGMGVSSNWDSGSTGNTIGVLAAGGSIVTTYGAQPMGTTNMQQVYGGAFINSSGTQISGVITSGLSCSWGTIIGGYVRHGNMNGTAMVTINIRITVTSTLSSGATYYIYGFPTTTPVPIAVSCQVEGHFSYKVLNTAGRMELIPITNIPVGNVYQFSATYITNS